jgi:hypothetical protein
MTETPDDDQPGFIAEEPEHCNACYRLIQPGQTYYLTIGQAILCEGCITTADAIRVTEDLAVVVEDGRLLVRRGTMIEGLPIVSRHLAATGAHPRSPEADPSSFSLGLAQ